ncbi:MAG: hypothetical protein N2654_01080 [Deltaproteobacteria bacterium]|nr:hypothetical protein [Deltaproteobacteria bacterium]
MIGRIFTDLTQNRSQGEQPLLQNAQDYLTGNSLGQSTRPLPFRLPNQGVTPLCAVHVGELSSSSPHVSETANRLGLLSRVTELSHALRHLNLNKNDEKAVIRAVAALHNLATVEGTMGQIEVLKLSDLRKRLEAGERIALVVEVTGEVYSGLVTTNSLENSRHVIMIEGIKPDGSLIVSNSGFNRTPEGRDKEIKHWQDLVRISQLKPNTVKIDGEPVAVIMKYPTPRFNSPMQTGLNLGGDRGELRFAADLAFYNQFDLNNRNFSAQNNTQQPQVAVKNFSIGPLFALEGSYEIGPGLSVQGSGLIVNTATFNQNSLYLTIDSGKARLGLNHFDRNVSGVRESRLKRVDGELVLNEHLLGSESSGFQAFFDFELNQSCIGIYYGRFSSNSFNLNLTTGRYSEGKNSSDIFGIYFAGDNTSVHFERITTNTSDWRQIHKHSHCVTIEHRLNNGDKVLFQGVKEEQNGKDYWKVGIGYQKNF